MNITARRNCGIEMRSNDSNCKTVIKNSNLTVVGDTTGNGISGFQSFGDLFIENSAVDVTGDGVGIDMSSGKSVIISGENTAVKAKSVNAEEDRGYRQAAILLWGDMDYSTHHVTMPDFTLNDGLAVTTPDAGRIEEKGDMFKSVLDTNGDLRARLLSKHR